MTQSTEFKYEIQTTWDNLTIDHNPVELILKSNGTDYLELTARGPFFNDPPAPPGPPGPFWQLWNYEVAEAFFLGDSNRYLEVELGPHGQYLLLLLNGKSNSIADCLPLQYEASINSSTSTWEAKALIPKDYFPPNVTQFNAYAIHGSDPARAYESLYPCPNGEYSGPDFHRLQYFQPINFGALIPDNPNSDLSQTWQDALAGKLNYTCSNS
ncbi:hypothetical protein CHUAL_008024 [Chamberlinius hualienensis]